MKNLINSTNLIILLFACFIIVLVYLYKRGDEIERKQEFSGTIEYISYDVKGFPYITVKGKTYYLSGTGYRGEIEVGDSITKKAGELQTKVIFKKTGKSKIYE